MNLLQLKWRLLNGLFCLFVLMPYLRAQTFQNLVPNGSFETYTQCPNTTSKLSFAPPWTSPTIDNTSYFNACSPKWNVPNYAGINNKYYYLNAKEGVAYTQIFVFHTYMGQSYRDYAQGELKDSLKNGICYYVEFYAANLQRIKYRTNNISACFTSSSLPTNLIAPGIIPNIQPHITNYGNPVLEDTVKWIKISGIYEAIGGEKYITIGNFKDNAHTDTVNIYPKGTFPYSYAAAVGNIFIDAVSVYSLNPIGKLPWSYRDTTIKKGDSVYIGNKMGGLHFKPLWFNANGTFIDTNAGITVSPNVTTKYYVKYPLCGVERVDTVKVSLPKEVDVGIEELKIINDRLKIYPNPASDFIELKIEDYKLNIDNFNVSITNSLGQMVREEELIFKEGKASINVKDLENGVYVLTLSLRGTRSLDSTDSSLRRSDCGVKVSKRFVVSR